MARYRGTHDEDEYVAGAVRRGGRGKLRRGVTGTAIAAAAMTALTASQAPDLNSGLTGDDRSKERSDETPDGASPGDDSYHTELPPLESPAPPRGSGPGDSGIPATVLAAYKKAAQTLAASDRGCALRWELLAAIGKVESGQARGGAVDKEGTTLNRILGPVLNGSGYARIKDTDGGRFDDDAKFDRAVGPMQFIPSTWSRWGADGNGDGRSDPDNIHDAALAAGKYLCAGERELSVKGDMDRAILSYNNSRAYLRTVLAWFEFYSKGTHEIPDGTGQLPDSPGAGGSSDRPGNGSGNGNGSNKPGNGGGGGGGGHDTPAPSPSKPTELKTVSPGKPSAGAGTSFSQLRVRAVDKSNRSVKGVRLQYAIIGDTGARFSGEKTKVTVTTDGEGVATAPKLNAGDETGKFFIRVTAPGHDVSHASFYATVEPRADELEGPSGELEAEADSQFDEIEVKASYKGDAAADVPMTATILNEDGKPVKSGPYFTGADGKPDRTLTDLKTGRDGLLGLLGEEGVLKLPTLYTDDATGTFTLRLTTPDGPTLDLELTVTEP
jgi:hypothetical protein